MKGKSLLVKSPGRDYAMIAAIVAILLSVAVLVGITFRYTGALTQARISQRG